MSSTQLLPYVIANANRAPSYYIHVGFVISMTNIYYP